MWNLAEWKRNLRWNGHRICRNCLYARELTEEEWEKYKNFGNPQFDRDRIDLYCSVQDKRDKTHHPHPTNHAGHCFAHEYDDDSVLLPKNPKWGGNDLWDYERERADQILLERNQISMEEL